VFGGTWPALRPSSARFRAEEHHRLALFILRQDEIKRRPVLDLHPRIHNLRVIRHERAKLPLRQLTENLRQLRSALPQRKDRFIQSVPVLSITHQNQTRTAGE
jgi:hypothetical protein